MKLAAALLLLSLPAMANSTIGESNCGVLVAGLSAPDGGSPYPHMVLEWLAEEFALRHDEKAQYLLWISPQSVLMGIEADCAQHRTDTLSQRLPAVLQRIDAMDLSKLPSLP